MPHGPGKHYRFKDLPSNTLVEGLILGNLLLLGKDDRKPGEKRNDNRWIVRCIICKTTKTVSRVHLIQNRVFDCGDPACDYLEDTLRVISPEQIQGITNGF